MTDRQRSFLKWTAFGVLVLAFLLYAVPIVRRHLESYESHRQQAEWSNMLQQQSSSGQAVFEESSPDGSENPAVLSKFNEFLKLNPETVGWIDVADGYLSLPVVQHSDNEYYLKHDFYGKDSSSGTIYLDMRIDPKLRYDNTVVYGHNLGTTTAMFNVLTKFRNPAYVSEHPIVQFDTLYREGYYVIFSVFIASTKKEHGEVFDYINPLNFSTPEQKQEFLNQLQERTIINVDVDVDVDDELLTLSTCTYEFEGARLGVVARRLRDGETPGDFANLPATAAANPKMPEIWEALYR